jgi:hypothetical protein
MTKIKSQTRSSNEKYCSSCPSKSKFIPKQKTCHSLSSYQSPSFSNALQSRTPYDLQWLQYYNGKASKVDYDVAPQEKEDSIEHYRENLCVSPDGSTQLSTQMKNGQLWLTIDGPNGAYQLPTWNSKSDYYPLGTNDTIILTYTYGGQSIGLGISGNDLSYQLYIFATCSKWYLINERSYPQTFYGSYSGGFFTPSSTNTSTKLTETGGSADNPIQACVFLDNQNDNYVTHLYINYYTENNTTYIYSFGGDIP